MDTSRSTPRRTPVIALAVGGVWAAVLVVAGFLVPVYETTSTSSAGDTTQGTATLVGENGASALVVLAIPLLATLLVAGALFLRPDRGGVAAAWVVTALLAGFTVLAIASLGLFVLPVTAALAIACASTSASGVRGAPPRPDR